MLRFRGRAECTELAGAMRRCTRQYKDARGDELGDKWMQKGRQRCLQHTFDMGRTAPVLERAFGESLPRDQERVNVVQKLLLLRGGYKMGVVLHARQSFILKRLHELCTGALTRAHRRCLCGCHGKRGGRSTGGRGMAGCWVGSSKRAPVGEVARGRLQWKRQVVGP